MKHRRLRIALALGVIVVGSLGWRLARDEQPSESPAVSAYAPARTEARRAAQARNDALTASEAAALAALPPGTTLGPDPREARCQQDYLAQMKALRARMDPDASPDAALASALLMRMTDFGDVQLKANSLRALETATVRWPDDVDLARHYFLECRGSRDCDATAAMARLQRVDGHNMATWLEAMSLARQRDDDAGVHAALSRAAEAAGYDSSLGTAFIALRPALASLPLPASCGEVLQSLARDLGRTPTAGDYADLSAMGIEMAVALPGLGALSVCREPDSEHTARDCRIVLRRLVNADTLIERMYPLRLLIELEHDPAAAAALREQYRRTLWLAKAMGPEMQKIDGFLWRTWAEGEIPLLQRHAESIGRWPPPADWLPDNPDQRALITGNAQR